MHLFQLFEFPLAEGDVAGDVAGAIAGHSDIAGLRSMADLATPLIGQVS